MHLRFTKMHGLGNDFVVIDAVSQAVQLSPAKVRALADRRCGIGCDQILLVEPPTEPNVDFNYRIFNADGSEAAQCGNGARCFAKFVWDQKLTGKKQIRVQTNAGILELQFENPQHITVNMGVPEFEPARIPFIADRPQALYDLEVNGNVLNIAALSLGNPHAVLRVDDIDRAPVRETGPLIQAHQRFPERVNAGFMAIDTRQHISLRVYERGVGETPACGSGACAAVVAGIQQELLDSTVTVSLTGGDLDITWHGEGQPVYMTGSANTVFQGRIKI